MASRITPGRNSFANIPDGVAGMETMIPVVFSEGVRNGHLSLRRFVKLTSINSARLFGVCPQKGTIEDLARWGRLARPQVALAW